MYLIEIILAANFFSFYFITQNRFPFKWGLDFKPLNCTLCLTAWTGLALYLLPDVVTHATIAMFGSGVISPFFKNFLNNLYQKQ